MATHRRRKVALWGSLAIHTRLLTPLRSDLRTKRGLHIIASRETKHIETKSRTRPARPQRLPQNKCNIFSALLLYSRGRYEQIGPRCAASRTHDTRVHARPTTQHRHANSPTRPYQTRPDQQDQTRQVRHDQTRPVRDQTPPHPLGSGLLLGTHAHPPSPDSYVECETGAALVCARVGGGPAIKRLADIVPRGAMVIQELVDRKSNV